MKNLVAIIFFIFLVYNTASCQTTTVYSVGQQTIALKDTARNRPLKTEIWYPTSDSYTEKQDSNKSPFILKPTVKNAKIVAKKFPLVMLSHGTGGNRISLAWLAHKLAGNGFVVAAVDHWGNTFDNKIPQNFVKIWDRPLDISFVISALIKHSTFSNHIDTTRIGVAGFSLGGYTSIALGGGVIDYGLLKAFSRTKQGQVELNIPELGNLSDLITPEIIEKGMQNNKLLKDNRISAFVAIAPAIGQGFKHTTQFKNIDKPLLIIGAQEDERTPVTTNAKHYHKLIKKSEYKELKGKVGHYVFLNAAVNDLQKTVPIYFKDDKSIDRISIHNQAANLVLSFLQESLK